MGVFIPHLIRDHQTGKHDRHLGTGYSSLLTYVYLLIYIDIPTDFLISNLLSGVKGCVTYTKYKI